MRQLRLTATILVAAFLPACSSYRLVADPAQALQASPKPARSARITYRSGEQVVLNSPWVDGDSLRGGAPQGQTHAVALADVSFVEVRQSDGTKTSLLVLGIVLATLGAAFGVFAILVGGG